jgi:SNF2 family DNA or RNA helicase
MQRVNEYGTKCAKLIQWLLDCLAEQATNRFILFSKYNDYLNKVSARLRNAGIENVVISGNVINKSKALKQFREEDVKVVLLSLERSASGMNLIEANYVVLLDPMDGTVEEARAYEIQALGRAHRQGQEQKVTLVRFVIQDSVEEELYLRNKSSGRETNNKLQRSSSTKQILAKSNSAASLRDILSN